jgi:hypothetical protein
MVGKNPAREYGGNGLGNDIRYVRPGRLAVYGTTATALLASLFSCNTEAPKPASPSAQPPTPPTTQPTDVPYDAEFVKQIEAIGKAYREVEDAQLEQFFQSVRDLVLGAEGHEKDYVLQQFRKLREQYTGERQDELDEAEERLQQVLSEAQEEDRATTQPAFPAKGDE